jgi:hypothetical protein
MPRNGGVDFLVFWERGAQNRGKEFHLINAKRQLSDKLFQAVVQ